MIMEQQAAKQQNNQQPHLQNNCSTKYASLALGERFHAAENTIIWMTGNCWRWNEKEALRYETNR